MNFKFSKEERTSIIITNAIALAVLLLLYYIKFIDTQTAHNYFGGGGGGGAGVAISIEGTPGKYLKLDPVAGYTAGAKQVKQVVAQEIEQPKGIVAYNDRESDIIVNKIDDNKKDRKPEKSKVEEVKKVERVEKVSKKEVLVPTDKVVASKSSQTVTPAQVKQDVSNDTKNALSSFMNGGNGSGGGGNTGDGKGGLSTSGGYYGMGTGDGTGSGNGSGSGSGGGSGSGSGGGHGDGIGTGTGSGSGYSLNGRVALVKPAPKYLCNEVGRVVVEVYVDKQGNTIDARPGVKGSTNTANCLLEQAKLAAIQTKWQANPNAPDRQVGQIIYNFNLR